MGVKYDVRCVYFCGPGVFLEKKMREMMTVLLSRGRLGSAQAENMYAHNLKQIELKSIDNV